MKTETTTTASTTVSIANTEAGVLPDVYGANTAIICQVSDKQCPESEQSFCSEVGILLLLILSFLCSVACYCKGRMKGYDDALKSQGKLCPRCKCNIQLANTLNTKGMLE